MSSILILGDIHLGKGVSIGKAGIGNSTNSRIVDQSNLLDWTLDQAIEKNVKRIVITGDVFEDPKPHPSLLALFLGWISKCTSNDIYVDIIMGNHDMFRTGTHYSSPLDVITECEIEKCNVYKDVSTIFVDSTAFTYIPFRDRKSFICNSNAEAIDLLKNIMVYELSAIPLPYTKVIIGHLAIEGSIPVGDEIDDLANELFCSLDMFEGYDYVWMGHVHKPQVMQKEPLIAHIGSMDISNFGESDHKKHIIIFQTDDATYEKIEIPTRKLTKINITIPKDTVDTTKYLLEQIAEKKLDLNKSIVRLEVNMETPELKSINRAEVEKQLYKSGIFNIAGFSESKKVALVKKDTSPDTIDTTIDVSAAIKMWAKKKWPDDADETKRLKFIEMATQVYSDFKAGDKK